MKKKDKGNELPEGKNTPGYSLLFQRSDGESDQEMIERTALASLVIGLLGRNAGNFTLRSGPYRRVYCQPNKYAVEKRDGSELGLDTLPASELKQIVSHYGLENPTKFGAFMECMMDMVDYLKEQSEAN